MTTRILSLTHDTRNTQGNGDFIDCGMRIYTNCRGKVRSPQGGLVSLDGHLDGWSWHAWSGSLIAYGPTEEVAVLNLRDKKKTLS